MSATDAAARLRALAALDHAVCSLNADEVAVLAEIAARLVRGRAVYAALQLSTDRRNWSVERAEELMDALVYGACARVQAARRAVGGTTVPSEG